MNGRVHEREWCDLREVVGVSDMREIVDHKYDRNTGSHEWS